MVNLSTSKRRLKTVIMLQIIRCRKSCEILLGNSVTKTILQYFTSRICHQKPDFRVGSSVCLVHRRYFFRYRNSLEIARLSRPSKTLQAVSLRTPMRKNRNGRTNCGCRILRYLLVSLLAWNSVAYSDEVEVPFSILSFEQAMGQSEALEKMVFINFYTEWCGPCKQMDRTTFQEPKVLAWLDEHTIPVSIDAEERTDLADRYFAYTYPKYVFVSSTGDALDHATGYMDLDKFISVATDVLNGRTSMERALAALENTEADNPMLRMALADAYAIWGQYEKALGEYLWCFDEGHKVNPSFIGVRGSFLLGDIVELADRHPPTRTALVARRDALHDEILNDNVNDRVVVRTFSRINNELEDTENSFSLFEKLNQDRKDRSQAVKVIVEDNFDLFIEHELYEKIVSSVDLVEKARFAIRTNMDMLDEKSLRVLPPEVREEAKEGAKKFLRSELAKSYYVLLTVRQIEQAQVVADLLLGLLDDSESYHVLAEAGLNSKNPVAQNLEQAQKAVSMSPRNSFYLNTMAHLMHVKGHNEKAINALAEQLELELPSEERELLENSLESFGGPN